MERLTKLSKKCEKYMWNHRSGPNLKKGISQVNRTRLKLGLPPRGKKKEGGTTGKGLNIKLKGGCPNHVLGCGKPGVPTSKSRGHDFHRKNGCVAERQPGLARLGKKKAWGSFQVESETAGGAQGKEFRGGRAVSWELGTQTRGVFVGNPIRSDAGVGKKRCAGD